MTFTLVFVWWYIPIFLVLLPIPIYFFFKYLDDIQGNGVFGYWDFWGVMSVWVFESIALGIIIGHFI